MFQRMKQFFNGKAVRVSIMLSTLFAVAMPFAFAAEGDPVSASSLLSDAGTKLAAEMQTVIVAAFGAFLTIFILRVALKGGLNFVSSLFGRRN